MAEIRYTFVASGADSVVSAFKSVESAAESSRKAMGKMGAEGQAASQKVAKGHQHVHFVQTREAALADQHRRRKLRAVDESIASRKREASERRRLAEKMSADEVREAKRSADKRQKLAERSADQRARAEQRANDKIARNRRHAFRAIGGKVLTAGVIGAGMVGAAGARLVGRSLREGVDLQHQATMLALKGQTGEGPRTTGSQILAGAQQVAEATPGTKTGDVIEGMGKFVEKVGRVDLAQKFAPLMAMFSVATGAKIADLGSSMADLWEKFDVQTPAEMADVMARLTIQGKKGSFEIADFAKRLPRLGAAARAFGIKGAGGVGMLGGLMQITRRGAGSGAQAATFMENLFSEMARKSGKIGAITGRKVFEKGGTPTDLRESIISMVSSTGGDITKLGQFKFSRRAEAALKPFLTIFKKATEEGKSRTEAEAALRKEIMNAIEAPGALAEVMKDASTASATMASTQTALWESVRNQIMADTMPAFDSLTKTIARSVKEGGFISGLGKTAAMAMEGLEGFVHGLDAVVKYLRKELNPMAKKSVGFENKPADLVRFGAEKKIAALEQQREKALGRGDMSEARRIEDQIDVQRDIILSPRGKDKPLLTRKQFEEQLTQELGANTSGPEFMHRRTAEMAADVLANDPTAQIPVQDQTPAIQALVDRFRETVTTAQTTRGKAGEEAKNALDPSRAQSGLQNVADAAASAAAALASIKPPTGGSTHPPGVLPP